MAIRYISEHDSPDDPGGIIREVLEMGEAFPGPAEDVVLTWVLRLGDGRDPAGAARRLIDDYRLGEAPQPGGPCGRVIEMLKETATFPEDRMTRHLCQPRRRGGWRRNRS
ncbi:hypothetical protein HBA54_10665 [Pelagibius litoralis]|uniref:Uncharacterized protein n=1 Tax=Pelagibius litoralis TaxID=374515 RepID=A0A967C3D6_9PROT|nr:hypothetical protein [Pelagibius litoralis]NIA69053.1 hypothetical protein [Pelagibius litoralis]